MYLMFHLHTDIINLLTYYIQIIFSIYLYVYLCILYVNGTTVLYYNFVVIGSCLRL